MSFMAYNNVTANYIGNHVEPQTSYIVWTDNKPFNLANETEAALYMSYIKKQIYDTAYQKTLIPNTALMLFNTIAKEVK